MFKTADLNPYSLALALATAIIAWGSTEGLRGEEVKTTVPKSRHFLFRYGATIEGLKEGQTARVWLPVPPSNDEQKVVLKSQRLPGAVREGRETRYDNEVIYFEATAPASGQLALLLEYDVTRQELRRRDVMGRGGQRLSDMERKLTLAPDRLGPITGKPLELLQGLNLPRDRMALARVLYDRVDEHVRYDKSRPGFGTGDVQWVCDSRFGNCCDFHSLFMALARSQGVPARFEMGFPLPDERGSGTIGGYHCWAFFHDDLRGWVPVDISEADKHPELKEYYFGNLTENRVTFSRGRDLTLVPPQAGPPLNYFVYPYVEVADRPLAKDQLRLNFEYSDLK